jgi:hypothetical protein
MRNIFWQLCMGYTWTLLKLTFFFYCSELLQGYENDLVNEEYLLAALDGVDLKDITHVNILLFLFRSAARL